MSTHSAAASSAVGRSFCVERKIIINLWFLTLNTFYTFTREWVGGTGGGWRSLTRRNFASMKNGFAPRRSKPQSLQQTRNAKFIHSARVVVVENWKDVCFPRRNAAECVPLFSVEAYLRHLFTENILLSSALKRARKIYIFSFHSPETRIILFNFAKTVWRCRSVAIEIEN